MGRQTTVRLSVTIVFGYFGGCFVGEKSSTFVWRYAIPCWLLNDCKMNDLEWPWVATRKRPNYDFCISQDRPIAATVL